MTLIHRILRSLTLAAGVLTLGAFAVNTSYCAPIKVELLNETDPGFTAPPEIISVPPSVVPIWLEALARDEHDLKLQVAQAFAKAYQLGLRPNDDVVAALLRELVAKKQHPAVRLQMAKTLVAIDARSKAADLWKQAQTRGLDFQLVVEPALANWKYVPVVAVWRKRLGDAQVSRRELELAIEGLAVVVDRTSAAPLAELVQDSLQPASIRIAASRAAGSIQHDSFEDAAQKLMEDRSATAVISKIAAAQLLRNHSGDTAQTLLVELAGDSEPAVAAIALERLLAIDAALVAPLNERLAASRDTKIRLLAVSLFDQQATPATVKLLGPLLDDIHPGVRSAACSALVRLATIDSLNETVRSTATEVLAGEKVRGLEQAALVLGTLDHEAAAPRLVELLEHPEPNVFITAAWALRKIAVPETAEPILAKIHRETDASLKLQAEFDELARKQIQLPDVSHRQKLYDQLAHLIETLGMLNHREAVAEFERYLPKPPLVGVTDPPPVATTRQFPLRAAIVDALGRMYAGEPRADLVKYFAERLSDENPSHPESSQVRVTSVVALTRLGAKDEVPTIDRFYLPDRGYTPLTAACAWALERLADGKPYVPQPVNVTQLGWFLESLDQ